MADYYGINVIGTQMMISQFHQKSRTVIKRACIKQQIASVILNQHDRTPSQPSSLAASPNPIKKSCDPQINSPPSRPCQIASYGPNRL